jgi:hypothetical protein
MGDNILSSLTKIILIFLWSNLCRDKVWATSDHRLDDHVGSADSLRISSSDQSCWTVCSSHGTIYAASQWILQDLCLFSVFDSILLNVFQMFHDINSFNRFQNSGNANDVTLRKSGVIYAAFGSALTAQWRSTGTCTIMQLTKTDVSVL